MDVVFVADASRSISELQWSQTKQFIIDMIRALHAANPDSRFAVFSFSAPVNVHVALDDDKLTLDDIEARVWAAPYMAGATDASAALVAIVDTFDDYSVDSHRFISYFISDGNATINSGFTEVVANEIHLRKITSYVIGKIRHR